MKARTKKRSKRTARQMVIEATTSDSPVPAFISLLRPSDRVWPIPESEFSSTVTGKKTVAN